MKTILAGLLISVLPLMASPLDESAILQRIADSPTLKEAGTLDALVLFEGHSLDYRDGRLVYRKQELIRLYSEYAIEHLGDPRIAWDRSRQDLEVLDCRSFLPDGSVLPAPDNAFNPVTPDGMDLNAAFLDLREMVVTRTGLLRGATVWLDYQIIDHRESWIPFSRSFFPSGEFPLREWELKVRGLRVHTINPPAALWQLPEPVSNKGVTSFRALNLPTRPHDSMLREEDCMPWLAVSSEESLFHHLQDALRASANEKGEILGQLFEDESFGDRAKLEAACKFAQDRTRRVLHAALNRSPRSVAEILQTSTATDWERTALLMALLPKQKMDSRLVFGLPALSFQNAPMITASLRPLLEVRLPEGPVWLDAATARIVPASSLASPLLLDEDGWTLLPALPRKILGEFFWSEDTLQARVHLEGIDNSDFKPETRVNQWIGGEDPGIRILESSRQRFHCEVSSDSKLPEEDEHGLRFLELLAPPLKLEDLLPRDTSLHRSHRDAPLRMSQSLELNLLWELLIPEAWSIQCPENEELTTLRGDLLRLRCSRVEDRIQLHCQALLQEGPISQEEYPEWRRLMLRLLDSRWRTLALTSD
ncbi:MAG: DUF3857 domain-containing protein [Candidatus Krumholzibacteria bacterium]|jgi:hypothetical protein|nr:DUF3857 domain-containing protein [Candidatus Krumholzibacteria bacterium]MDP6668824.1 DUF3857 domain-containing protein [Candidatus Krumholzibacteria bacterium]MDP6796396.1 DUF3857 domain-containing protein [Candidatus Krumholzibacteria bacterium]MDP7022031.1 DUF3857 domain-containing protein [Candidatus Krumholzibacteria bacterium]